MLVQLLAVFFNLLDVVVSLVLTVLIVNAVLSWLISFEVVDRRNRFIATVWDFSTKLTDPMLRPIRKIVPNLGGIDLAPMVLALGLIFGVQILRVLVIGAMGY